MTIREATQAMLERIANDNDGMHWDFIVPGYAGKKMVAYQGMREDLIICIDAATRLKTENPDGTLKTSLFYNIIILYAKCFSDATNSKLPKLETKDCFFSLSDNDLLETHKSIIEARNTLVAHRGEMVNDLGVAYLKVHVENGSRQFLVRQRRQQKPNNSALEKYVFLFEHVKKIVEAKFEKAGIKVWKHLTKELSPKAFAQLRLAGPGTKLTID
jgi:hypothetical protein